jgi:hypothetical protein
MEERQPMDGQEMTTLKEIFEEGFVDYASEHHLPYRSYQAANAIMNCRTAAMGGHVQQCENGHVVGVHYNSCRHRSCPQCNERSKSQWAEAQAARLLDCDHYHVVFTLPHELLQWWSYNRGEMADLLFSAANGALMSLLKDPRHLGAKPGIVASLHTWGRTLSRHPHVHCLVSGGGISAEGRWEEGHGSYLVPVKALKLVYRGKLLSGLQHLLEAGELRLPEGVSLQAALALLRRTARKSWNVRVQERYAHGQGVLRYLARYVRGGPISNRRLVEAPQGEVCFRYQDHRDGKPKLMQLSREEFIDRVLWHVPESGRHTTRHYGLYAHKAGEERALCRAALGQPPEPERAAPIDWQSFLEQAGHPEGARCERCGARIARGPTIAPRRRAHQFSIARRRRSGSVQQADQAAIPRASGSAAGPPAEVLFFSPQEWPLI